MGTALQAFINSYFADNASKLRYKHECFWVTRNIPEKRLTTHLLASHESYPSHSSAEYFNQQAPIAQSSKFLNSNCLTVVTDLNTG